MKQDGNEKRYCCGMAEGDKWADLIRSQHELKKRIGFKECPVCGAGHKDYTVICHECGYKGV